MKKLGIRILSLLGTLVLIGALLSPAVLAADATSAVSVSASSVNVDSTFTVTVKVSGHSLASIEGMLTYDANVVEFVSGSGANGTGGTVKISVWDTSGNGSTSLSCSMTFKAKAAGSSSLTFTPSEIANSDFQTVSADGASTSVSVVSPTPLSSNANLSSLKVSSGTLSPAFSANTTSYSVTVENAVTKLTLSAVAQDPDAKISVSGSDSLSVGSNTRTITVTAPSGATKKYTVRITRKAAPGSSSQAPSSEEPVPVADTIRVTVDGKTMTVVEDLTGIDIPAGFELSEQALNDNLVVCVRNKAGIPLIYLSGEEVSGFYVYDNERIAFDSYAPILLGGVAYLPLEKPRNLALPRDFAAAELTVGETVFSKAWQSQTNADFYLLYLCGPDTYVGFYQYDSLEGTVQRFVPMNTQEVDSPITEPVPATGVAAFIAQHWLALTIAVGVVLLGLTLALILVAVRKGRSDKPDRAEQKDEAEGDFLEDLDGIVFNFEPSEADEPSAEDDHKEE